jgi:hypothetical protein
MSMLRRSQRSPARRHPDPVRRRKPCRSGLGLLALAAADQEHPARAQIDVPVARLDAAFDLEAPPTLGARAEGEGEPLALGRRVPPRP